MNFDILPSDYVTFFGALFSTLVMVYGFIYVVIYLFKAAAKAFSTYLTTSINIHNIYGSKDVVWLENFIKEKYGKKLRHFQIPTRLSRHSSGSKFAKKLKSVESIPSYEKYLEVLPSNGRSVSFWYNRTYIRVHRNDIITFTAGFDPVIMENVRITAYWTKNKQILIDLIEEARQMAQLKPDNLIAFSRPNEAASGWSTVRRFKPRKLSSVVLREGVMKSIEDDIIDFLDSRKWYEERGIPYRRGYLLYGPPGCGKTSFIKAISGRFGYNVYKLSLTNAQLTDEKLSDLISKFSKQSILLLEDIDAVFTSRFQDEEKANGNDAAEGKLLVRERKSNITFSGLLNVIDGVSSEEDYIIFMTTNHIAKLDSALIRPGRIDIKQLIDYPDEKQIVEFFKRFYPDCNDEVATKFAQKLEKSKCTPSVAQIQGLFIRHKNSPEDSLADVESLVKECQIDSKLTHPHIYI